MIISSSVYARVGLAGNPSDGFYGKTLSACVKNWQAFVSIEPRGREGIIIMPNTAMDTLTYKSLQDLANHTEKYGYYGTLRLIKATCSLFQKQYQPEMKSGYGFSIKYNSTIPRQVGLGGSSALVMALLNCLLEYYQVEITKAEKAHLAWSVENKELGITAGLQDRVAQAYGGLVYMDLADPDNGKYEQLYYELPPAFIAYTNHPCKESGQIHNPIRYRFEQGDREVIETMAKLAKIAQGAKSVLGKGKMDDFGHLMKWNFTTRLGLYGDIGQDNIKMIEIATELDCPVKLPGSGGAVIGLYKDEAQYQQLEQAYYDQGFEIVKVLWDR